MTKDYTVQAFQELPSSYYSTTYLMISTLELNNKVSCWSYQGPIANFYYSYDATNWQQFKVDYSGNTGGHTEIWLNALHPYVYFKRTETAGYISWPNATFQITKKYNLSGKLSSIYTGNLNDISLTNYKDLSPNFKYFRDTPVVSARYLNLNIDTACFQGMFKGCTYLDYPPAVSHILKSCNSGFAEMYSGCTSLTRINVFNADLEYAQYICANTYYDCSKIKMSTSGVAPYSERWQVGSAAWNGSGTGGMFVNTGGSFQYPTYPNTWYYTSNELV